MVQRSQSESIVTLIVCVAVVGCAHAAGADPTLEYVGEHEVEPAASDPDDFGGISGLAYDGVGGRWIALRDHPPTVYQFLLPADRGRPIAARRIRELPGSARDAEALASAPDGSWFVAYESPATALRFRHDFGAGDEVLTARNAGARLSSNRAWESAMVVPSTPATLMIISETGAAATPEDPTSIRRATAVLIDPDRDAEVARGEYTIDPPDGVPFGGAALTEIVPLDASRFLALERTINARGLDAAINLVKFTQTDGVLSFTKHRLGTLRGLGITRPGNAEAMALGPVAADGSRLLVILNDNRPALAQTPGTTALVLRLVPERDD